ncbi:uncharacterized protein LOC113502326 [Trichoplusia ni]|uniref:Uncharacterized protein LOC113502326 n=1 Tax=Trichoplusia ni TaxID=7111 RepID=A0A7E5WHM7_TRINI|nr:uncharacterized protein LOC113502326 [Trichoplusia ni]
MLWFCLVLLLGTVSSHNSNDTGTAANITSNPCTDLNHIFLAPGVLTAGGINKACMSRFHTDGIARLLLTLVTEDRQTIMASRELPPGDGGCLDINVPQLPNSKADLIVNMK